MICPCNLCGGMAEHHDTMLSQEFRACEVCNERAEHGYARCSPCLEATCLECGEVAEDADRLRTEGCLACIERSEDTERIEWRRARGRVR